MINNSPIPAAGIRLVTTEELASTLAMSPQSIRKRFCLTGEYFGIRPIKMPNGRLFWPSNALEQLAAGKQKQGKQPCALSHDTLPNQSLQIELTEQ